MKRFLILILCSFILCGNSFVYASSYIAVDVSSGRILSEKNSNDKSLIASTTKIMTCIVVLENSDLNKKIIVGDEILKMYGTSIYLEIGEVITIKDLLYGLMLRSGNDAAEVLANHIFSNYDEFISVMNNYALKLGMMNTKFYNPHGLDEYTKNISTAYDMSLLARYCFKNKEFKKIISCKKYSCKTNKKSYIWYNRVDILNKYEYSLGGKNGYTPSAGKTLVSYAKKNKLTILMVTLDNSNIYSSQIEMFNSLFNEYSFYKIIDKDMFSLPKNYYLKKSFSYPLKYSEKYNVSLHIYLKKNVDCTKCGKINVLLNDTLIGNLVIYRN